MDPDPQTPAPRKRGSRRRNRRRIIFIGLIALVLLGSLGLGGWGMLKKVRQERTVKRARVFLENKDYTQAAISAAWALQLNPKDAEATRVMAEIGSAKGEKQELIWWARLADLQPDALEPRLTWAKAALHHREVPDAERALAGLSESQRKGAAYHAVVAQLAATLRQVKSTEANLVESVRLEPDNELYQLELAAVRLGSDRTETRSVAREEIERLAADGKASRPALHVLIRDALVRGDAARALGFAEKLNASPDVHFEDRMQYLRLLRRLNRREFWWCLGQMQREVLDDEKELPALMTYLNKSGMPQATADWGRSLPDSVRKSGLVPITLAESFIMLKDWDGLNSQVKFGHWGDVEFQRLALLARVAREQGDLPGSAAQWKAATVAAALHPPNLNTLVRLATTWKWTDEANGVLWQIARGPAEQMPALQALSRSYQLSGNTRELLAVANRMIEVEPKGRHARNNVAYLSLLLDVDKERAHALARDVYQEEPDNAAFVSTYALALHLLGRTQEGLKLLRALPPKTFDTPAYAFSYGVLLAAASQREDATKYLNIAETSSILFPQEKAMLASAREWLTKP